MNALEKLQSIRRYRTDKYSLGYYSAYCFHFDRIRFDVRTVLEIGTYKGESLELWKEYFSLATVVGVDIKKRYIPNGSRIFAEIGDAIDPEFINYLVGKYGVFDIVIDDGSHMASQMKQSFSLLWPYTKMIYCIDDLGTQYKTYRGRGRMDNDFLDAPSMMEYLKEMVDLNNSFPEKSTDYKALCFHRMQCFVYKKGEY